MTDFPASRSTSSLSVVIPVHNEELAIPLLAAEIDQVFSTAAVPWQTWWIDDGSTDGTPDLLRTLKPPHHFVRLAQRAGKSAAYAAGFQRAQGLWIATLDGDGQDDPADLLRQLGYAQEHRVDLVGGIRGGRCDTLTRRLSSRLANHVRRWITGDGVHDIGCGVRVIRRQPLQNLPFFDGMHRFLPTLLKMQGCSLAEIPVNHRARIGGCSKYGIANRWWAGLNDLMGVRWLMRRQRALVIAEESPASPMEQPSAPAEAVASR